MNKPSKSYNTDISCLLGGVWRVSTISPSPTFLVITSSFLVKEVRLNSILRERGRTVVIWCVEVVSNRLLGNMAFQAISLRHGLENGAHWIMCSYNNNFVKNFGTFIAIVVHTSDFVYFYLCFFYLLIKYPECEIVLLIGL